MALERCAIALTAALTLAACEGPQLRHLGESKPIEDRVQNRIEAAKEKLDRPTNETTEPCIVVGPVTLRC